MARNKGSFNFAANFEVLNKAPLDSRMVVDTKENLITPAIWEDSDNNVWIYKGLTVSVIADSTPENNGLYFLLDDSNYTNYASWLKINSSSVIDASGTTSVTFQLNTGDNGVVLKDSSGNLEVVTFDGSTFANIQAGHLDINSIKIDTLNGALYATDGSVYSVSDSYPLKAFQGEINGNGITSAFTVDHSLNTLRQNINIYDDVTNEAIFPDLKRGLNSNIITFHAPPSIGATYEIIILGF